MYNSTQCQKDKKGIKKAVTGLVNVPVSKTLGYVLISYEMA